MNEIKLNEFNTLNDIDNINNDDEINTAILKNETTFINSSFMDDLSIFGDSVVYSNTKYEYEDINSINEKLNTSFSLVNNLKKTTLIKGISVMGRKKKRAKIINQPNAYLDERNIDLKKMIETISTNVNMREIDRPFSILLRGAHLNKIFKSYENDNGNILTYLIFKMQLFCGKKPFSKPKIIKWKTYNKDINPIFNKRIYFECNYSIIPNICSIMFEIKFVKLRKNKEIKSNETLFWNNFNLFDFSKRLRTGQHKIKLYESSLIEDSYYRFLNNTFEDNTSIIYFEIDSFPTSIINKVIHITNYSLDIKSVIINQNDNEKINEISLKTPSEELNNYDKEVLWTNRYKIMEYPKIITRLLSCFNYNEPRDLIELEKLFEISKKNLNTIQAIDLLNGYFTYDSIRNFAVECLRKSPIEEIKIYLYQLIQGLKYEIDIDNELARFLIDISVSYPFTIGHKFFWYLRSEMNNKFYKQKFGLYLDVFLNKIGEEISKVFYEEDFLMKNIIKFTNIMRNNSIPKNKKKELFKNSINEFNDLLKNSNLEISLPYDYKLKINSILKDQCLIKKDNSSLIFTFNNIDSLSKEIQLEFYPEKDIRTNMITIQIFNAIRHLWIENNLKVKMSLYNIITTGYNEGIIEILKYNQRLSLIMTYVNKNSLNIFKKDNPIKNWFDEICKIPSKEFLNNFYLSVYPYLICDFVLGVNDRNNDNIRIKFNGELFQYDFNNLFGVNKNYELNNGVCKMVFNYYFKDFLKSQNLYKQFKQKIWNSYLILRNNKELLYSFMKILILSGINEIKEKNFKYIELSLNLIEKDSKKIQEFFKNNFDKCKNEY